MKIIVDLPDDKTYTFSVLLRDCINGKIINSFEEYKKDKTKKESKKIIKKSDIEKIVAYYNLKTGRNIKCSRPVKNAITKRLDDYSCDEICKAIENMLLSEFWGDIFRKDIIKLFRERNKNGDVDLIMEFQEKPKEKPDFVAIDYKNL